MATITNVRFQDRYRNPGSLQIDFQFDAVDLGRPFFLKIAYKVKPNSVASFPKEWEEFHREFEIVPRQLIEQAKYELDFGTPPFRNQKVKFRVQAFALVTSFESEEFPIE